MNDMSIKIGNFLFKYRSFTPIPLIITVLIIFKSIAVSDNNLELLISLIGILIAIIGEMIRILSVGFSYFGTSGRENYLRAENLNTSGIYSLVRNPLYIGNFLMFSGLLVFYMNYYALLIFDLFLIIQYYFIIKSEENYLTGIYKEEYLKYKMQVNSVLPRFANFEKPNLYFNLKKVVFKENDSIFNMIMSFIILHSIREKNFSTFHITLIIVSVLIYIFVKIWKKKGNIDIRDKERKIN